MILASDEPKGNNRIEVKLESLAILKNYQVMMLLIFRWCRLTNLIFSNILHQEEIIFRFAISAINRESVSKSI
ncbi:repressor [Salmonella enterica subsp. enterica]|nr:repressor [Salmonella enterica subsp. enterica] [Salmonella enterica subsp. enterica serovar Singapore]